MDKILKIHFDEYREKGKIPKELEGKFSGKLFGDTEILGVWRNNRKGLRHTDKKSGIILMGALDDLFVTNNGQFAPLDFKTRGYPLKEDTHEHYQHQMDIYSYLLEKNNMKTAGYAILIFYHPKRVTSTCNVEFNADPLKVKTSIKDGEKIFLDAVKCLSGKEPNPGKDCGFCRW
ncbi:MAG: PD-(D/E)XK nuclease family protein [Candidatus Aenigmatarchaeota archaeon]